MSRIARILPALLLGASLFTGALTLSCKPNGPAAAEEQDVAVTFYDPSADFSELQTYIMPDSVVHREQTGELSPQQSGRYDALILETVAGNMATMGYQRILDPTANPPDVVVLVTVTGNSEYRAYVDYHWFHDWIWYGGWDLWGEWNENWVIGYPYVSGDGVVYSESSIYIDWIDVENADEDAEVIPSFWIGAVNGLLEGTNQSIINRITRDIDQCFDQSPYLRNIGDGKRRLEAGGESE